MNSYMIMTDQGVSTIPAEPLTSIERQKVIKRGLAPYVPTLPPVYMCGSCRNAKIDEGAGLCRTCDAMFTEQEAHRAKMDALWPFFLRVLVFGVLFLAIGLAAFRR